VGIPIILAGLGIAAAFRFMETYPWVLAVAACGLAVAVGPAMWRAYRAKGLEAALGHTVRAVEHATPEAQKSIKGKMDNRRGRIADRVRKEIDATKRRLGIS